MLGSLAEYRKQKTPGRCIYSAKRVKYGQTTVTIKKSHLETEKHTSHDQFKSVKLIRQPFAQSQPREPQRREKNQPKESLTLLVVGLTRYRRSPSCYPLPQNFLSRFTVQTVPPLYCGAVVVVVRSEVKDRNLTKTLSAKTKQQPPPLWKRDAFPNKDYEPLYTAKVIRRLAKKSQSE